MLKLWGRTNSSNVKKVMWACAELGIPYERIDAGLHFGIVNTDEFREKNPNGLVPVIEDDGFVLWESHAIIRYLCAKHPKAPFYPADLQGRASAERWMDWQLTTFSPLGPAFQQIVRMPQENWDMKMITANLTKVSESWKIADRQLGKTKWLNGDEFTMADVPLANTAYIWFELPLAKAGLAHLRVPMTNLDRWYAQLNAMPNYREIVAIGLT